MRFSNFSPINDYHCPIAKSELLNSTTFYRRQMNFIVYMNELLNRKEIVHTFEAFSLLFLKSASYMQLLNHYYLLQLKFLLQFKMRMLCFSNIYSIESTYRYHFYKNIKVNQPLACSSNYLQLLLEKKNSFREPLISIPISVDDEQQMIGVELCSNQRLCHICTLRFRHIQIQLAIYICGRLRDRLWWLQRSIYREYFFQRIFMLFFVELHIVWWNDISRDLEDYWHFRLHLCIVLRCFDFCPFMGTAVMLDFYVFWYPKQWLFRSLWQNPHKLSYAFSISQWYMNRYVFLF